MPFDKEAVKAVNSKKQCDIDCAAGKAVREVYKETIKILSN